MKLYEVLFPELDWSFLVTESTPKRAVKAALKDVTGELLNREPVTVRSHTSRSTGGAWTQRAEYHGHVSDDGTTVELGRC